MKEYKISTEKIEMQKRKRLMYSIPSIVISSIAGISIGFNKTGYNGNMFVILPPVVVLLSIAIIIGLRRGNQINNDILNSYKIELLNNSIRKYQKNVAIMEIEKSEVILISETVNKGLVIKTSNFNKYMDIPEYIDGYSDLKESLSYWMSITTRVRSRNQFILTIPVIGVVLGFGITMLCNSSYIVIPVGVVMILVLIGSVILIQNNPHIDARIKKSSWLIIFPIISLFVKVLSFIL